VMITEEGGTAIYLLVNYKKFSAKF